MYGQELAEEISKRRGERPNPGTIYPALKDLQKRGLIHVRSEGRKTIYQLTSQGQSGVIVASEYFCRVFGEIVRSPAQRE